jgi:GT2 family glycosyltransferase
MEAEYPFFSIIVPTHNRPKQLLSCLGSIARLDYPRNRLEVIVVADGCEVPPGEQIDLLRETIALTILSQSQAGPAAARNSGALNAKGDYLIFTDDDCMPLPNLLKEFARGFSTHPNSVLGGRTINALPLNPFSSASHYLMEFLYDYYNAPPGETRFFASNNLAAPLRLFRDMGGFSEHYALAAGEDRDFCRRWRRNGYGLVHVPEAVIEHAHELDLVSFIRQQFNYGRGGCRYHLKAQDDRGGGRNFWPFSVYVGLLTYPLRRAKGVRKLSITLLFILSQLAVTAGMGWERMKIRGKGLYAWF